MAAQQVKKYEIVAAFRDGTVTWNFNVMTDDGAKHAVEVRDGAEIPILLDLCRRDWTIYFDTAEQSLSSGWNLPGGKD